VQHASTQRCVRAFRNVTPHRSAMALGALQALSDGALFQSSIERSCRLSSVMIEESAEPLAEDRQAYQALGLDREYGSPRVGVQIRTSRRRPHRGDASPLRWSSLKLSRLLPCNSRRTRFSSFRQSMIANCSRFTQPATAMSIICKGMLNIPQLHRARSRALGRQNEVHRRCDRLQMPESRLD
jgi:hypothetical protein